jgi:SAM-dependent methyltransferase
MAKIKNWLVYKVAREIKNCCVTMMMAPWQSMKAIFTLVKEHCEDNKLGIETSESVSFKDDSANKDGNYYSPVPYDTAKRLIGYLRLGPDDVFVDLGCGKGRVCFLAAFHKIKKAIGVDIDKELVDMARENLRTAKMEHAPITFTHADVAVFDPLDGTVFFMYNPFGYRTLGNVIENIRRSFTENPRDIRIAYFGPGYREVLDNEPWLGVETEVLDKGLGIKMVVWRAIGGVREIKK